MAQFPDAMPLSGLVGGAMIGLAAAMLLLLLGRIAGISGLAARAAGIARRGPPWPVAAAFVVGLPIGAALVGVVLGRIEATYSASIGQLAVAGLVVGFGTRLGSGCTSGHGVCGISRFSRRSLVAMALTMVAGIATVAALRAAGFS